MKLFTATFISHKTKHPDGEKEVRVCVKDKFQKTAINQAWQELALWDPDNTDCYRQPKMGTATTKQFDTYLQRKEALCNAAPEDGPGYGPMEEIRKAILLHPGAHDCVDPEDPNLFIRACLDNIRATQTRTNLNPHHVIARIQLLERNALRRLYEPDFVESLFVQNTNDSEAPDTHTPETFHQDLSAQVEALNKALRALQPGERLIRDNLPNTVYHQCEGYSSTNIKEELISPWWRHGLETGAIEQKRGRHFDLGNYVHALLLTPDTVDTDYVLEQPLPEDGFDGAKVMKEAIKKHNAEAESSLPLSGTLAELAERVRTYQRDAVFAHELKAEFDEAVENGKTGVTLEDQARAKRMVHEATTNPASRNWFRYDGELAACERSYFWRDEEAGLVLKARPDKEIGNNLIDVKSIEVPTDVCACDLNAYINRQIEKRGYHISAAHYLSGTGKDRFFWIFINKVKGYEWVAIVEASPLHIELGTYEVLEGLRSIASSTKEADYPAPLSHPVNERGIPQPLMSNLSTYAMKRLEQFREL